MTEPTREHTCPRCQLIYVESTSAPPEPRARGFVGVCPRCGYLEHPEEVAREQEPTP